MTTLQHLVWEWQQRYNVDANASAAGAGNDEQHSALAGGHIPMMFCGQKKNSVHGVEYNMSWSILLFENENKTTTATTTKYRL